MTESEARLLAQEAVKVFERSPAERHAMRKGETDEMWATLRGGERARVSQLPGVPHLTAVRVEVGGHTFEIEPWAGPWPLPTPPEGER